MNNHITADAPAALDTPNLQPLIALVVNSVSSEHSRRAYRKALGLYMDWWRSQGQPPFVRATVLEYRVHLESTGLAPSTINQRLAAIRKLASEAADNGLIPHALAMGITSIKGTRAGGRRTGNWLTKEQAQDLINLPDTSTLIGKRDRALLALQIGTGLRRSEVAALTFEHVQQVEGRWAVVDIRGKRNKVRTVGMPPWSKVAIDKWAAAAGISTGNVFRPVDKSGRLTASRITPQVVYRVTVQHTTTMGRVAAHDLRRTYAKLAHKGGAPIEQISISLGHESIETTQRYLGIEQDLNAAPCDFLGLDLNGG